MAKTLAITMTGSSSGVFKNDSNFNDSTIDQNVTLAVSNAFANGTGADQANMVWSDERTLADDGTENIDLAGGLTDAFGTSITFTGIKAILIHNQSGDAGLEITPAVSNGFLGPFADASDQITVPAGGQLLITNPSAAGWAVTAGTGDLLTLTHDGTGTSSLSYKIVIVGIV